MGEGTALTSLFTLATHDYINSLVRTREGETKLGQRVQIVDSLADLHTSTAKYVLLGIPEDIGVRANYGIGGTHTLWEPALRSILNTQSTDHCPGTNLIVLGAFNFSHWMKASESMDPERMRSLVDNIDEAVYPIIEAIVRAGKIPIIIGGGHNNAYPIIQGTSYALNTPINCINLDPHTDYRRIEGRHSGNPFRYARRDGFLSRYAMVALHRAYNSQEIIEEITTAPSLHHTFYEDIFIAQKQTFKEAITAAITHTTGTPTGIELDLDSIAHTLSSAATPVGITPLHASQYLHLTTQSAQVAYYHLPEGATELRDGRKDPTTAKLLAYLVTDILSSNQPSSM